MKNNIYFSLHPLQNYVKNKAAESGHKFLKEGKGNEKNKSLLTESEILKTTQL